MNYNYNQTHQRDGRNGNGSRPSGGGSGKPPPRSTLANLLSSQRRSAAQSDRHRVQRARPFADSSQVDRAMGRAVDNKPYPSQPSQDTRPRGNYSHQAGTGSYSHQSQPHPSPYKGSYNHDHGSSSSATANDRHAGSYSHQSQSPYKDSHHGSSSPATATAADNRQSSLRPCRFGTNCRNPTTCPYTHNISESNTNTTPTTSNPNTTISTISRRIVRFNPTSDSTKTFDSEERPRKRKSRWDVRPRVAIDDDNNNISMQNNNQTHNNNSEAVEKSSVKEGSSSQTISLKEGRFPQTSSTLKEGSSPQASLIDRRSPQTSSKEGRSSLPNNNKSILKKKQRPEGATTTSSSSSSDIQQGCIPKKKKVKRSRWDAGETKSSHLPTEEGEKQHARSMVATSSPSHSGDTTQQECILKKKKSKRMPRWDTTEEIMKSSPLSTEKGKHHARSLSERIPSLVSPNEEIVEEVERSSMGENNTASANDVKTKRSEGKKFREDASEKLQAGLKASTSNKSASSDVKTKRRDGKKLNEDASAKFHSSLEESASNNPALSDFKAKRRDGKKFHEDASAKLHAGGLEESASDIPASSDRKTKRRDGKKFREDASAKLHSGLKESASLKKEKRSAGEKNFPSSDLTTKRRDSSGDTQQGSIPKKKKSKRSRWETGETKSPPLPTEEGKQHARSVAESPSLVSPYRDTLEEVEQSMGEKILDSSEVKTKKRKGKKSHKNASVKPPSDLEESASLKEEEQAGEKNLPASDLTTKERDGEAFANDSSSVLYHSELSTTSNPAFSDVKTKKRKGKKSRKDASSKPPSDFEESASLQKENPPSGEKNWPSSDFTAEGRDVETFANDNSSIPHYSELSATFNPASSDVKIKRRKGKKSHKDASAKPPSDFEESASLNSSLPHHSELSATSNPALSDVKTKRRKGKKSRKDASAKPPSHFEESVSLKEEERQPGEKNLPASDLTVKIRDGETSTNDNSSIPHHPDLSATSNPALSYGKTKRRKGKKSRKDASSKPPSDFEDSASFKEEKPSAGENDVLSSDLTTTRRDGDPSTNDNSVIPHHSDLSATFNPDPSDLKAKRRKGKKLFKHPPTKLPSDFEDSASLKEKVPSAGEINVPPSDLTTTRRDGETSANDNSSILYHSESSATFKESGLKDSSSHRKAKTLPGEKNSASLDVMKKERNGQICESNISVSSNIGSPGDKLKGPWLSNSVTGTSPTSLGIISQKNILADAVLNSKPEKNGNNMRSEKDEKIPMSPTELKESKKDGKDCGVSMGRIGSEKDEKPFLEKGKAVNSSQLIEPTNSIVVKKGSTPKLRQADPSEDTLEQKQNIEASPKLGTKENPKVETLDNMVVRPLDDAPSPCAITKKKKKKDSSPFRIKVGCVVAIRFRKLGYGGNSEIVSVVKDGDSFHVLDADSSRVTESAVLKQSDIKGNDADATNLSDDVDKGSADVSAAATKQDCSISEKKQPDTDNADKSPVKEKKTTKRKPQDYEVWSAPSPGQDDGISLLGSWIRCAFKKSFVANWQKNNKNGAHTSPGNIVEGNVISILENDGNGGVTVGLLVDRSSINSLRYLQVLYDDSNDPSASSSKEKRRKLEAKIRGENKVVVRVVLASAFDQRNGSKLDPGAVSHWVIRKRVSAIPAGKQPSKVERKRNKVHAHSMFIGDGNDTQSQQEQNWRWIASQTSSQLLSGEGNSVPGNVQDSVSQLVGEVIDMDVSPKEKKDGSASLATVTIRRLWTPEQTELGRLVHHGSLELFDMSHDRTDGIYFQAPIEDLIVIGKRINRYLHDQPNHGGNAGDDSEWKFAVTHSYHAGDNTYTPLCEDLTAKASVKTCHYCQRLCHHSTLQQCQHEEEGIESLWCPRCSQLMNTSPPCNNEAKWKGPCCTGKCDCCVCRPRACEKLVEPNTGMVSDSMQNGIDQAFSDLVTTLESKSPVDFRLPNEIGKFSLRPSFLPKTGNMKSISYSKTRDKEEKKSDMTPVKRKRRSSCGVGMKSRKNQKSNIDDPMSEEEEDDEHVFKPVCNRIVPFDQLKKRAWGSSKLKLAANEDIKEPFFRESARPRAIKIGNKTEEKTDLTGRAARASQRRMVKSLAAMGDDTVKVDRLAGRDREQQLRFDKSQIHGWGVFAEESINAGDMIIEYRGEIIGNAVADKRELEYEKEKLDDYMFRIDAYTVCDATILGNVARYINSSCSPNCHTKIVTAGENKRIVIYAKRDICKGEELAYDYKFSLEYDPTKRIPCHCGSTDCIGFMNWDKKYL